MMGRYEPAAEDPAVVTAADVVAGPITLGISCRDRLYLKGYVAKLQTPGGVVWFFHDHRGKPIVSPALFEPIGEKFRREIKDWAQASGVPVIRFRAGERKADVMAPYLDAAAAAGRSQVVAVGCAQEFQLVWTARKRDTDPGGCPQFSFTKEQRRVSVFYVYIFDERMGPGFIKICTYFPYPVKAWVNGHEWAKRQALATGIGFTQLSNGFASCDARAGLQQICDRFGPRAGLNAKIDRPCDLVTLNVYHSNSRLKQYVKDGTALRVETVVNDAKNALQPAAAQPARAAGQGACDHRPAAGH